MPIDTDSATNSDRNWSVAVSPGSASVPMTGVAFESSIADAPNDCYLVGSKAYPEQEYESGGIDTYDVGDMAGWSFAIHYVGEPTPPATDVPPIAHMALTIPAGAVCGFYRGTGSINTVPYYRAAGSGAGSLPYFYNRIRYGSQPIPFRLSVRRSDCAIVSNTYTFDLQLPDGWEDVSYWGNTRSFPYYFIPVTVILTGSAPNLYNHTFVYSPVRYDPAFTPDQAAQWLDFCGLLGIDAGTKQDSGPMYLSTPVIYDPIHRTFTDVPYTNGQTGKIYIYPISVVEKSRATASLPNYGLIEFVEMVMTWTAVAGGVGAAARRQSQQDHASDSVTGHITQVKSVSGVLQSQQWEGWADLAGTPSRTLWPVSDATGAPVQGQYPSLVKISGEGRYSVCYQDAGGNVVRQDSFDGLETLN